MLPPSDDFDRLREMLSLLAHETPPPGYFHNFSSKVIARIEAETHQVETGWWERLVAAVGARPWAGAAAAALAAVLVLTALDKLSAFQPSMADADPFLSGAPIALQAAMLDRNFKPRSATPDSLPTGPGSRMNAIWTEPPHLGIGGPSLLQAGAVLPASFTPAY